MSDIGESLSSQEKVFLSKLKITSVTSSNSIYRSKFLTVLNPVQDLRIYGLVFYYTFQTSDITNYCI